MDELLELIDAAIEKANELAETMRSTRHAAEVDMAVMHLRHLRRFVEKETP